MYPKSRIDGGGAVPTPDWKANLPASLKDKIPANADGVTRDGNIYIFTEKGNAIDGGKYNADGSKYDPTKSDNANPEVRTPSGTSGSGNGGRTGGTGSGSSSSTFGFGFSNNTSGDIGASFINAGYTIDAEKFMGASMGFGAMSSLAQMMPFGLGAVFANNSLGAALNNFMKSVSFNFDFSNMKTRAEQEAEAARDNEGATAGTETGSGSGSGQTVAELAKARGYTPTDTQGVYQNNGKFFKYDEKTKEFVECKADGSALGTAEAPATPSTPSTPSTPATPAKPETPATPSTPSTPATPRSSGNQGGYNVSKHTSNVFWKNSGGATHYYVKQNGKMVEISGYDGEKYTLNGKTYDAKTGKEVTAAKPQAKPKAKPEQKTSSQKQLDAFLKAGYKKEGDYYRKGNDLYAFHVDRNGKATMTKIRQKYHGGYWRGGPTTMALNGRVVGRHTVGQNAGTYFTGNSSQTTIGHSYGNGNYISKEKTARDTMDTDAQFTIGKGHYNLKWNGKTLDYYDITGSRTAGQSWGVAFVNADGSFNTKARMFDSTAKPKFSGEGEFKGCTLERVTDQSNYTCLCVKKDGVYYDFDTLMRTGQKVAVRPGTFFKQG